MRNYSNIALDTTLVAGINAGDLTCTVVSAAGYPAVPFAIVLDPGVATEEVCQVTLKVGTTFTITRGFDGTTAQAHALGATVRHAAIAGDFTDLQAADTAEAATRASADTTLQTNITAEATTRATADLLRLLIASNLSDLANVVTARGNLGLGSLAVLNSITASLISDASANGRSLITAADYAAMKVLLSLVIGTNVQAWNTQLDAIAALSTTAYGRSFLALVDAAAARTLAAAAPLNATYITQTANSELSAEQALSSLASGYVKVTTGTGVLSSQATPIPQADLGSGSGGLGLKFLADDQTYKTISAGGVSSVTASAPLASSGGATPDISFTGILASTLGGTGINNAGKLTLATDVSITGGGTLALAGFTLTVPATGTAALLATSQTFTATHDTTLTDAVTAATSTLLTLDHESSGTPAASFGSRLLWNLKSDTTAGRNAAAMDVTWGTATDATRTAAWAVSVAASGALTEGLKLTPTGLTIHGSGAALQVLRTSDNLNVLTSTANTGVTDIYQLNIGAGAVIQFSNGNVQIGRASNGLELTSFADMIFKNAQFTTELARFATTGAASWTLTDAATATVTTEHTLKHNSSGTPATGFGSSMLWQLKSSTTIDQSAADWAVSWATATHARRKARFAGSVYDAAAREWIRAEADGARPNIGLLGASDYGSGSGVIAILNATTAPSATPSGGGVLYVEAGALKYKGSSGTVTTLGVA